MKQQSQYLLRLLCLLLIAAVGITYQVRARAWQRAAEENRAEIARVQAENAAVEAELARRTARAEEAAAAEAAARAAFPYADGIYTASAPGFGGDITVTVTLAGRRIADITVDSHPGEDPLFYTEAEAVVGRILTAQSADVDAVSGATFSSAGIREAVRIAMDQAKEDV